MDILINIYGWVGAKRPILSLCVVTIVGAALFGLSWMFLGFQWNQKNAAKKEQHPTIFAPEGSHNQNIQKNNGTAIQENK